MIPLHEPEILSRDINSVLKTLQSGWVSTSGEQITLFERKISKLLNIKYVLATNSGTSSLFLALKVLGVTKNEEVIVPTLTFIATVNSIKYNNAEPIFMDVDDNLNIDEDKTIRFLEKETFLKNGKTYNLKTKKRIKALIFVHTFGNLCKIDKLIKECKKRNIVTVEDAAESLGSYYTHGKFKNKYSGSIADIGCLSFNGNKIITTGSGGALLTNNKKLFELSNYLANQAKNNPINYTHNSIGFNLKMSNLSASLGISQISLLKNKIQKKINIFNQYKNFFKKYSQISLIEPPKYSKNNYWLILLNIKFKKIKKNKLDFINYMKNNDIQVRPVWKLNHLQKPYIKNQRYNLSKSTDLVDNIICIPSSSNLKKNQIFKICKLIIKFTYEK
jgi:perosamine synthetase